MDRRLIDHFVNANLLSRQDMQRVILRASKDKTGVVTQVLDAGLVEDELLAEHIAQFYQYELLDSRDFFVDPGALRLLTENIARKGGALAYGFEAATGRVLVATYDPGRAREVIQLLESATGLDPLVLIAPRGWLERAIPYYYKTGGDRAVSEDRTIPDMKPLPAQVFNSKKRPKSNGRASSSSFRGGDRPLTSGGRSRAGLSSAGRSSMGRSKPGRSRASSSTSGARMTSNIDSALDEFEDFLNDEEVVMSPRSSFAGRPRSSQKKRPSAARRSRSGRNPNDSDFGNISSFGPEQWEDPSKSKWSWDDLDESSPPSAPPSREVAPEPQESFSLFEPSAPEHSNTDMTLHEIVEMHHQKIKSLKEEAQRQREVIQALADLLVEARVINRRELKRRLKKMRRDE